MEAKVLKLEKGEQAQFDINSVLAGAETKKEKSNSKIPVLKAEQDLKELASKYRELQEQITSLKSEQEIVASELIAKAEIERERLCNGNYYASVKIPDTNGLSLTLSWKHQYSKIALEKQIAIEDILNTNIDGYLELQMEIKVKDNSENSLRELISLVGVEKFAHFFEVERWLYPTENYTRNFFSFSPEQREKLTEIIKQYKPAIKVR